MKIDFVKWIENYGTGIRALVYIMAALSAVSLLFIVVIVMVDVIGRFLGSGIQGSADYVRLASAIVMGGALPYTTAVKGHIAVELIFRRIGKRGKIIVDTISRLLMLCLFILIIIYLIRYGESLHRSGEVTPTIQLPIYWVPFWLATSFGVTSLVKIYHILRPGRELIKP
ncbi:MAG TPA: TRAP transporter small permease subunit [Candidatus Hydrogenedens sp.]|nr:TRAP transporter small permease subunit [Candidatus Hydrogenedens sp.]